MRKIEKWRLLKEEDISPSHWFPLFKHKVKLPNGKIVDGYYISKLGDVSMVVALTKKAEVVFVRQYKHGAGEVILELPAGRIRKGNTPEEEARMELEEETGYIAKKVELLGFMFAEPSKDTQKTYGFLVRDVEIQNEQNLDETEDIEVVLIPARKVDEKISEGEIKATDTIAILRLAQLKAPDIFQ
ncbi:hypothetical protein A2714_04470 [Candidatus Woesebacteria bacterium RIFCSPHIGHO2_01_FULL_38_9]|uniref:Nudix hydrolase domain-containing protein n=2 Tax=Candidatus Woeseibacteriota TaxID=1752722 RepID=A0A1F7XZX8_9BACT|nr:MAG: hypothetical protein A2714_04470 [Candidatus Woesebacteria bacterium RIFCSPHIGHO2_01_FULL_38_9]OGM58337.1 MAG: hypothetical protein A3A75_04890 [Candidatus Woesebacteria bacterium RIFCSPLOWO2_01_FULL_39_10]